MKTSFLILFPLLLILLITACEKPTKAINNAAIYGWNEYKNPTITRAVLRDTLPKKILAVINVKEIQGIRANHPSGKYTCYFEYEADAEKIITALSRLPFEKSNAISDTTCRALNTSFSLSGRMLLSNEELVAANFFWTIQPDEFDYYECIKAPTRHTILVNKITGRILHRVETTS